MAAEAKSAPVGAQVKRVIDLLLARRQAFTAGEIKDICSADINSNKAVFDSLSNNPKVKYDGKCFSYKPKHDLEDKSGLLELIRKSCSEGITVTDLKDAYANVMEDLEALKAGGHIWLLSNSDSPEDIIAYPNDDHKVKIKVDDDLKLLFRGIELPRDMLDIQKYLQENGMKPAANRRAAAAIPTKQKIKKKTKMNEISKRTKLTNAHLPELFQILAP